MLNNIYVTKGLVMNFRKTMIFFSLALAVSVTLRTLMIFFTTEASSGFFKKGYEVFSYGMMVIIISAILLCIVFAAKCSRPKAPAFLNTVNTFVSVLLGLSIGTEALFVDYSGSAMPWQNLLQTIFGVLSCVVFMWLGIYFSGLVPAPGIFLIIPAVFFLFRIIVVFITYSGVSTIADNVFELASLCASLIFMMQYAKIQNSVNTEKTNAKVLPTALAACLIIFTQVIPIIIAMLSENDALIHSSSLYIPSCLFMGIFILCTSVFRIKDIPPSKFFYTPRHDGAGLSVQDLILNADE